MMLTSTEGPPWLSSSPILSPRPDQPQLCPPPPGICHAFLDARSNDRLPAPFRVPRALLFRFFFFFFCSFGISDFFWFGVDCCWSTSIGHGVYSVNGLFAGPLLLRLPLFSPGALGDEPWVDVSLSVPSV
ncbi:hypothetical protein ASPNIDRAFT_42068 [Aspergillus niger ATCC 1015]|uniref:Uncharacterized protein n=1 Tax=Aspergillus niger (strain ATCC 1015 / CBS 113.46 / FGSC A1144 / LSHB Ac4 / NCTC 3858a / NRRL 328 / USDA 3528.7) TaxID=380704 RepID=G3XWG3_ASPNA|nr:hypothetical protein ASPNIDRAFT_42068 [Aspergillus niger ATCC 1015]